MIPFGEDDDWPDEPEEFDPDSLGPDVPRVERTAELTRKGADAPEEVQNAFWAAVLFANVGLMGVSLGAMLVFFRGDWVFGGGGLLVGTFALLMTYQRYRRFMNREQDPDGDGDGTAGDD